MSVTKQQVRVDFDPEDTSFEEVQALLSHQAENGNIEPDYLISGSEHGDIQAHFDVSDSVEHPERFMFTTFTPYAKTSWHNFE